MAININNIGTDPFSSLYTGSPLLEDLPPTLFEVSSLSSPQESLPPVASVSAPAKKRKIDPLGPPACFKIPFDQLVYPALHNKTEDEFFDITQMKKPIFERLVPVIAANYRRTTLPDAANKLLLVLFKIQEVFSIKQLQTIFNIKSRTPILETYEKVLLILRKNGFILQSSKEGKEVIVYDPEGAAKILTPKVLTFESLDPDSYPEKTGMTYKRFSELAGQLNTSVKKTGRLSCENKLLLVIELKIGAKTVKEIAEGYGISPLVARTTRREVLEKLKNPSELSAS
jgi:hypothetical protein